MSESEEKYLKTIFILAEAQNEVRSIDIASTLRCSKDSVCRAMKILKEYGYITMESHGRINLTQPGYTKAKSIFIREFLDLLQ